MEMRALSSVGARLRAWLETFFYLSALKSKMREQIGSWLEMLLGGVGVQDTTVCYGRVCRSSWHACVVAGSCARSRRARAP